MEFVAASVFCWYLCLFCDWTVHKLGHLRVRLFGVDVNPMYRTHMAHHKEGYPVGKLLRPAPYQGEGAEWAVMPPITLLWLAIWYVTRPNFHIFVLIFVESVVFLLISDHLHTHYHTEGSYLERFEWFQRRRAYHFLHHRKLQRNMSLGGISTLVDRLLLSYVEEKVDVQGVQQPSKCAAQDRGRAMEEKVARAKRDSTPVPRAKDEAIASVTASKSPCAVSASAA
eukprot:gnl/TRDRNA2_/TRDRNA2_83679_c0_seq1.p1 gnl/TRDRNA2_/TRDRNA2_83679_c0~~gnl/TRDRNA2_/TRDRNA2_83679_c0_seq1.p1  ORF type:complete len:249 (+),score=41.95 gnl/TRDRNA2_/TRDRNA2_83679_c0_seq1:71-748(+)